MSIPQALPKNSIYSFEEPSLVAVLMLPFIEAEGLLIQITEKVKRFDVYISPFDRAFEQRPEVFHAVSMDMTVDVANRMINHIVRVFVAKAVVASQRVRMDFRSLQYVLTHIGLQFRAFAGVHGLNFNSRCLVPSSALQQSYYRSHGHSARFDVPRFLYSLMHITSFSPDESFIHFHNSAHLHKASGLHGVANPMKHEPSGFLSHAKRAMQLVATNPVLRIHDQPKRAKPFIQTNRGVFKNSSNLRAKLFPASFALPHATRGNKRNILALAMRAINAIRPTLGNDESQRNIRVREVFDALLQRLGKFNFVFHNSNTTKRDMMCQLYYCQKLPLRHAGHAYRKLRETLILLAALIFTCKFHIKAASSYQNMKANTHQRSHRGVDFRVGNMLIEVKRTVDAVRTLQTSLMQLAYYVGEKPESHGYLMLLDSPITPERLRDEWERATMVLRKDILDRLTICFQKDDSIVGIPHDLDLPAKQAIAEAIENESRNGITTRVDYSFIIRKLLIHQWLTSREFVTAEWLGRTAGCSYPAVARALRPLGSLLERTSDRRVSLRWFPKEEFDRLLAIENQARSTARFVDPTGEPRPVEAQLRRLDKMKPGGLAIGGVLGAKHYYSDLDLVGAPRLDLSLHCPNQQMNLKFVEMLDPALKRVEDPLAPATLVVHAVRHANALFAPRDEGLAWADPVECLFDLYEAGLKMQATQFLEALQNQRPAKS